MAAVLTARAGPVNRFYMIRYKYFYFIKEKEATPNSSTTSPKKLWNKKFLYSSKNNII